MSKYRKVETAMWGDRWFRSASQNGKFLWVYLLTGQRTTHLPGLILATETVAADDLGWSVKAFREAFAEASSKGRAKASPEGLIYLPRALFKGDGTPRPTSRPESPNVLRSWGRFWPEIPECSLKDEYLLQLKAFAEALGEGFAKAYSESFPEPSAKVEAPFGESVTGTVSGTGTGTGTGGGEDARKARVRPAMLPDDWEPLGSDLAFATTLGIDAKYELEKMRDWARSNATRKADWHATFRNWLKRASEDRRGRAPARDIRVGRVEPAPPEAFIDDGGGF